MRIKTIVDRAFKALLSPKTKKRGEKSILFIAIIGYLIHLSMIILSNQGVIQLDSTFFDNPIAAIYTPFTFILVYEVYLLIFFLPKSISSYIGKQYEIITLIVIRRTFKDISQIELSSNWFTIEEDIQFTYDVLTAAILFFLIYLFYSRTKKLPEEEEELSESKRFKIDQFVSLKKAIATLLVPTLLGLAVYSFYDWITAAMHDYESGLIAFKHINNIFFDEFFTILIVVDVLLLLASFFYSDRFHTIIRNSGFVISTILIKMSFSVDGLVNNALIIGAVSFGFLILIIHNLFENKQIKTES